MIAAIADRLGPALIPGFIVLDLIVRHRKFDAPGHWRARALLVTIAVFFLAMGVATFWGTVFAGWSLLDLSGLGIVGGAPVGILVYQLIHYGYHRLAHGWDPLWRWSHQMHHSAEMLAGRDVSEPAASRRATPEVLDVA